MSDTDLMIPEAAEVPAYIRDPEAAKIANEEAAAGISTGFPPRIKLAGKQFTLVDGNGDETPYPPAKMVPGPDGNVYFPVIILRAKKNLSKTWYAASYNPDAEAVAPDCFSNDSERPDTTALIPQSDSCAMCPMNAWGSGTDQDGNATKGKACADTKMLAAFVPNFGVHSFKIPPASLKNFGLYVKQLSNAGIPVGNVKTLVGFDLTATFPILVFRFGGYVGEQLLPMIAKLAASTEAEDAIGDTTVTPAAPAPHQIPAPVEAGQEVADDDMGLGGAAAAAATARAKADAAARAKADAAAKAKAAAATAKAKADAAAKAKADTADATANAAGAATAPTDAELMAELGLS